MTKFVVSKSQKPKEFKVLSGRVSNQNFQKALEALKQAREKRNAKGTRGSTESRNL